MLRRIRVIGFRYNGGIYEGVMIMRDSVRPAPSSKQDICSERIPLWSLWGSLYHAMQIFGQGE